ncbi:pyrroline-5-carboxylate reductase [Metabacillus litoralis]|uniref:pyrroline-5-carboxylate reductase n=1 Tax=Metabacillus litoralis TaxID=152268 RepID=UPI001CFED1D9|nr:pyrroline-5-carboxylate reductase [Metabacillus litoralis]
MKPSILFVGAGRMAEAIISGLQNKKHDQIKDIFVTNKSNPTRLKELESKYGVIPKNQLIDRITQVDIIVLAMPPKDHEEVLKNIYPYITNQLIITIAAGIGPEHLEKRLPKETAVGWIMPNTAAEVGQSISLYAYGHFITDTHKQQMELIVNSIGASQYCSEEEIHKLTAITGSSPAFLYQFVESLISMTEELGMTKDVAQKLVTEMVIGSAEMLKTGKLPSDLREQVTTPGGATAEGLKVLKMGNFEQLIKNAVIATNKKAKG